MIFPLSATSQSIDIEILDDTGLPVTGLVAATFPTLVYSLAGANADVAFPALSDLATITTAYASGGVKERGDGVYRLDLPNGIFTTAGQVRIRGEATGKHVICPWLEIAPSVASVVGAVGSVTGAVGSVTGSVGSVTGSVGGSVVGDVQGKVLGGGASALTGVGVQADLQTIKAQTVTCSAGVTIGAFVGNATHSVVVDASGFVTVATNNDKTGYSLTQAFPTNFAALGISVGGHITTVDTTANLTNAPTAGDFTAAMKTSLNAATPASVTGSVGSVTGAVGSVAGNVGGSVVGDVEGKVLGGGVSALTGTGVRAVDASGSALATAANQTTIITDVGLCQQAGAAVTLPTIPANWIDAAGIAAGALNGKGDWLLATSYGMTSFTESLPAVGAAMTEAQLLYEIRSLLAAASVSSSTLSTDTLAGTAKATYTLTLDGSGNPTGIARAT